MPPANLDVSEQIVEDGLGSGNMYWMNNGYKMVRMMIIVMS